jgi:hypothetical protein
VVEHRVRRCRAGHGVAEHLIAGIDPDDALAHPVDDTGRVAARNGGQLRRHRIAHGAAADPPVDRVDSGGPYRDPDLPHPGVRFLDVNHAEHFGTAVLGELHCPNRCGRLSS